MRPKHILPLLLAATLAAGCESFLEVEPISELPEEQAITGPISARAALAGLYDGLSDGGYYDEAMVVFTDLSSDDVQHTGTFGSYRVGDLNNLASTNGSVAALWEQLYITVGRANTLIDKLPDVPGLEDGERNQMLGEAYFVRALTYHNLVKIWGDSADTGPGVPLRLEPPGSLGEASQITRATTGEVYAQIFADLDQAESLMSVDAAFTTGSIGAVSAIRARAHLYRQNWAQAEAAAEAVEAMGYALATNYEDLFLTEETEEDIFRVSFTATEFQWIGYYYRAPGFGGRWEVGPTVDLIRAWSPGYDPLAADPAATFDPGPDLRAQYVMRFRSRGRAWSNKIPSGTGDEDIHVIRYAEVLLIRAEAEARQGGAKLLEAVATLNLVRERAGLIALNPVGMTQQQVLDAIFRERRLELAFEGDRWPDLVRRGIAAETMGIEEFRELYPIPLGEIDVAPGLTQNEGYQ